MLVVVSARYCEKMFYCSFIKWLSLSFFLFVSNEMVVGAIQIQIAEKRGAEEKEVPVRTATQSQLCEYLIMTNEQKRLLHWSDTVCS